MPIEDDGMIDRAVMNDRLAKQKQAYENTILLLEARTTAAEAAAESGATTAADIERLTTENASLTEQLATQAGSFERRTALAGLGVTDPEVAAVLDDRFSSAEDAGTLEDWAAKDVVAKMLLGAMKAPQEKAPEEKAPKGAPKVNKAATVNTGEPKGDLTDDQLKNMSLEDLRANQEAIFGSSITEKAPAT